VSASAVALVRFCGIVRLAPITDYCLYRHAAYDKSLVEIWPAAFRPMIKVTHILILESHMWVYIFPCKLHLHLMLNISYNINIVINMFVIMCNFCGDMLRYQTIKYLF
jgi:hypothetical protein